MVKNIEKLDLSQRYTYADYLTWQFDERVELIKGKVFRMSPAPGTAHQRVSGALFRVIANYLYGRSCEVFSAPFDVRIPLPPGHQTAGEIDTVVQPDISVICDPQKLDDRGCQGPPDWIIEVLSKGTSHKDLTYKFELYQHAGVKEYWIVHPLEGTIIPYRVDEAGVYQLIRKTPFVAGESVPVGIFPDLSIALNEVFPNEE